MSPASARGVVPVGLCVILNTRPNRVGLPIESDGCSVPRIGRGGYAWRAGLEQTGGRLVIDNAPGLMLTLRSWRHDQGTAPAANAGRGEASSERIATTIRANANGPGRSPTGVCGVGPPTLRSALTRASSKGAATSRERPRAHPDVRCPPHSGSGPRGPSDLSLQRHAHRLAQLRTA